MQFIEKLLHPFKEPKATKEKIVSSVLSEEFLRHLAKQLRFFRYVKARGGFDGDINKIVLALRYDGQEDLLAVFDGLCIPYKLYSEKPPQPQPGKSYSSTEFDIFPSLIPGTNWVKQPIWQTIDSVAVSVWGETNSVKFTITGSIENQWRITETEFENAKRLENIFEQYVQRIIDPPVDSDNCICPKYYPQFWDAG